ncbi:hypothetical protein BH11ACT2_BH11ACT2_17640 [soil metagenome]
MPTLLAACVVAQLRSDPGTIGTTAIDKRAVDGAVKVGTYGLYADVQADRTHHGGLAKALYAYAQEDADYWAAVLDRETPAGWFGENLRLEGVDVNGARIGERWGIGSAIVEVTMPRTPCQTFARWVGGEHERGWVKRFSDERRLGAYLRVVTTGRMRAGDTVDIARAPAGSPTILDVYTP